MKDAILLQNLIFHARHGVLPSEADLGQRFEIDLELELDTVPAGHSDQVRDTVNYAQAYEIVRTICETRRFNLIEALAETLAGELLRTFPRIDGVVITVRKPGAPIRGLFDHVGVRIRRDRRS